MVAHIWKTEFHVTEKGDTSPSQWFDEDAREEAIAAAKACGGKVEEVTSYLDDRETIFDASEEEEAA